MTDSARLLCVYLVLLHTADLAFYDAQRQTRLDGAETARSWIGLERGARLAILVSPML